MFLWQSKFVTISSHCSNGTRILEIYRNYYNLLIFHFIEH